MPRLCLVLSGREVGQAQVPEVSETLVHMVYMCTPLYDVHTRARADPHPKRSGNIPGPGSVPTVESIAGKGRPRSGSNLLYSGRQPQRCHRPGVPMQTMSAQQWRPPKRTNTLAVPGRRDGIIRLPKGAELRKCSKITPGYATRDFVIRRGNGKFRRDRILSRGDSSGRHLRLSNPSRPTRPIPTRPARPPR